MATKQTSRRERRRQIVLLKRALETTLALSEIPGTLHKEPALRDLLCRAGRHDFEILRTHGRQSATLKCPYCGAHKRSQRIELKK
jgi:hypothetical protein